VATVTVTRRFDLTGAQWTLLEQLLPVATRSDRPRRHPVAGAVGAPWRDGPACYGSWQAVYGLFRDGAVGVAHTARARAWENVPRDAARRHRRSWSCRLILAARRIDSAIAPS
jgi:transposase